LIQWRPATAGGLLNRCPGSRHSEHRAVYNGSPAFARSQSAAARIFVRGVDDATANQIDTRHDGYQGADTLSVGSLTKKWSASIAGVSADLTYPIIADRRIFALANVDRLDIRTWHGNAGRRLQLLGWRGGNGVVVPRNQG